MLDPFGSLVDRLSGIFGRGYLLAGIVPVLVIGVLAWIVAYDVAEGARGLTDRIAALDGWEQAGAGIVISGVVAVAGFVYWSLNGWMRAVLEGSALPGPVRRWLRGEQERQRAALHLRLRAVQDRLHQLRRVHPTPDGGKPKSWVARLRTARKTGAARRTAAEPSDELRTRFDRLERGAAGTRPVSFGELSAAYESLTQDLAAGPVEAGGPLDRLHLRFLDLLTEALARTENEERHVRNEIYDRFPSRPDWIGPTALANIAAKYREAAYERYGFNFELFWLHLQRAVAQDEHYRPVLDDAKLRLDTAVAMTWAFAIAFVILAPIVLGSEPSLPVVVVVTLLLPLAVIAFERTIASTARAFSHTVIAAVDMFRWDVLHALHLAAPADLDAEVRLWKDLADRMMGDGGTNLPLERGTP